jgi:hypothetical protein
MGVPVPEFEAIENPSAEALLGALKTIDATERRKHATVFNYWLSIRGDRAFPPIRDLNPLEISDAGPHSLLLELVGGGEDAAIRHIGHAIKGEVSAEKLSDAGGKSFLSCIAAKLPILAATREAFAFEEDFEGADGPVRCWVTLLPFSTGGTLVDFVYGYVTIGTQDGTVEPAPESEETAAPVDEEQYDAELVLEEVAEVEADEPEPAREEPEAEEATESQPGFSGRFSQALKSVAGFYGRVPDLEMGQWQAEETAPEAPAEAEAVEEPEQPADEVVEFAEEPDMVDEEPEAVAEEPEAVAEEPEVVADEPEMVAEEPEPAPEEPEEPQEPAAPSEAPLHSILADVRSKADEARLAKLRSNVALYKGLSAAYDFALDAEEYPEDYLRIVEAQGLKIQLRSPMKPVVKLAFDGLCDEPTIARLEAVLAWALKQDLPRGSLAERIQSEGGIEAILAGQKG